MVVGRRSFRPIAYFLFAFLLLLLPAAINGGPLLYPDTGGYLQTRPGFVDRYLLPRAHDAEGRLVPVASVERNTITRRERSRVFGTFVGIFWAIGGLSFVLLVQTA